MLKFSLVADLIHNPEGIFLLEAQNTLLYKFFIVEIKVDLKHIYDDNDVDLIEKS